MGRDRTGKVDSHRPAEVKQQKRDIARAKRSAGTVKDDPALTASISALRKKLKRHRKVFDELATRKLGPEILSTLVALQMVNLMEERRLLLIFEQRHAEAEKAVDAGDAAAAELALERADGISGMLQEVRRTTRHTNSIIATVSKAVKVTSDVAVDLLPNELSIVAHGVWADIDQDEAEPAVH